MSYNFYSSPHFNYIGIKAFLFETILFFRKIFTLRLCLVVYAVAIYVVAAFCLSIYQKGNDNYGTFYRYEL